MSPFTINHVGMVVPNIERFLDKSAAIYSRFKYGPIIANQRQSVREIFLTDGQTVLELLEPVGNHSPLAKFLHRNPLGGLAHLAFDVDALESTLAEVEAAGGRRIVDPIADVAFDDRRIAFVMLAGQIIELIERPK